MCDNDEAKLYPSRFREMGKAHSDADGLKILIMEELPLFVVAGRP